MKVIPQGAGRLNWFRYLAVELKGAGPHAALRASLTFDGTRLDVPFYRLSDTVANSRLWVITFPYVESANQSLELATPEGQVVWRKGFSPSTFNVANSISCRVKPNLTQQLLGIELKHTEDSAFIEPIGTYPFDKEHEVLRIRVSYPEGVRDVTLDPAAVLVGADATDMHVLECGAGDDGRHHITLSYRLPKDADHLIFATPGGEGYQPWIFHLTPGYRGEMVCEFAEFAGDAAGDKSYPKWLAAQRPSEAELDRQRSHRFDYEPLMSIVVPVFQAPLEYLQACITSVLDQTYGLWELIVVDADPANTAARAWLHESASQDARIRVIELEDNLGIVGNTNAGIVAARGDYICFLDQDDLIEPDALYEYVSYINQHRDLGALYCDEDSLIDETGAYASPRLKPDYNPDALYGHNYVVHMLAVSRAIIDQVGLSPEGVEGAQDYDLVVKASELAPVGHVPRVLYHWRNHEGSTNAGNVSAKPYAIAAGAQVLESHFSRCGIDAAVEPARSPYTYRVSYRVPGNPLVSVIIPTKDHPELLGPCVETLLEKAGWDKLEILLVENNSTDPETFAFYDELLARDSRIRLLRYEGTFNYSKIINWAAGRARGEYLLMLNNDTQLLSADALRVMLGYFQRPEVGVVGPLLLFPDGLVQTAGLALMSDGRLGFLNQNLTLDTHGGYLASLELPRDCSAVLGAAQMVSKALFDEIGGYDEDLAITYNDVDFCWRARKAGRLVVYTPYAQLMHREFATRGHDSVSPEKAQQTEREAQLMRSRWAEYFTNGDPELNPQCDSASPWFKLPKL